MKANWQSAVLLCITKTSHEIRKPVVVRVGAGSSVQRAGCAGSGPGEELPEVEKVRATVVKVVHTQEVRDQFAFHGAEVATGTSEEFRKAIQQEIAEHGTAVKAVGLKPE